MCGEQKKKKKYKKKGKNICMIVDRHGKHSCDSGGKRKKSFSGYSILATVYQTESV